MSASVLDEVLAMCRTALTRPEPKGSVTAAIARIQMKAWVEEAEKTALCTLCGAGNHETTDHTRTCGCPCHGNGPPPPDYSDPREPKERP